MRPRQKVTRLFFYQSVAIPEGFGSAVTMALSRTQSTRLQADEAYFPDIMVCSSFPPIYFVSVT